MSHIVQVQTEVRDPAAVHAACRRLALPRPAMGTAQLYSGQAEGLLVRLPDWLYPIVVHVETGRVQFDNFGGAWGRQEHLDRFLQRYALEKAHIEARKRGHTVVEQALPDGSVKLTVTVGGAS